MKLKIKKMPIYGLTISTGKIETFTNKQEALQFFTNSKSVKPSKIKINPKKKSEAKFVLNTPEFPAKSIQSSLKAE